MASTIAPASRIIDMIGLGLGNAADIGSVSWQAESLAIWRKALTDARPRRWTSPCGPADR